MTRSLLACTVRGCGRPLDRGATAFACAGHHAFDIARRGYVNLLQPQDRRSPSAGDARAAIEARSRLFAAGIGRGVAHAVADRCARDQDPTSKRGPVLVDLGCGGGDALALAAERSAATEAIGIDISIGAIDHAARHHPACTWVVANADRAIPLQDHSAGVVMSLHARRNPSACARVLQPGGRLIVAVPAPDDLVELRERILGEPAARDRSAALLAEHAAFDLIEQCAVRERHTLDAALLRDLLLGTYRGARRSAAAHIAALERLDVTLASDLFVFAPRLEPHAG